MTVRWIVVAGLVLYGLYGVAMVMLHRQAIYPFDPRPFADADFARRAVPVAGAADLTVYWAEAGPRAPVVVYFMGNVGTLELFRPMLDHHRHAGRAVLAMTYRGGGGLEGRPSEARLKADTAALMQSLPDLVGPDPGPIVLHGYSLGTGLALHAAAQGSVDGVILSAPFDRLCSLMARASWLPACLLPGVDAWRSTQAAGALGAPVLILHGAADTLIPPDRSARLAESLAAGGVAVERRVIAGGGHSDLMGRPGYLEAIDAFVAARTGG